MMTDSNPQEFQRLPVNDDTPPAEFSRLPVEYAVPEEYPEPQIVKSEKKKGSSARKMLALCTAGVVALQLLFGYVFPIKKQLSPEEESYRQEILFGTNPKYDLYHKPDFPTNLNVRKPKQRTNVTDFMAELGPACEKMLLGEYTLAAMQFMDAIDGFAYHSGSDDLKEVVMVWEDGEVELFDCQDLREGDGVYIFFYPTMYYYTAKESDDLAYGFSFNATLLVSDKSDAGDHIRMLTLTTDQFMLMSSVFSCTAQYVDTTFDQNYNAINVERLDFVVGDSYYSGGNTPHDRISGDKRLVGNLQQDTFVGSVDYYFSGCELSADGTRMIPVKDVPQIRFKFLENGELDITGMGLLDSTEIGVEKAREIYNNDLTVPGCVIRYEELVVLEIRCEDYEKHRLEFVEDIRNTRDPLFTTGESIEFWRVIQSHLDQ